MTKLPTHWSAIKFTTFAKINDIRGEGEYDKEERHIQAIEETEDAYIVTFGKSMPEREQDEDEEMEMERDNFDRSTLTFRAAVVETTEER